MRDDEYRIERDSLGEVKVPAECLWGAQTERSRQNFPIGVGHEQMPQEIIHAFGYLKKACALANGDLLPKMTKEKMDAIVEASEEILSGMLDDQFPLVVFQTGSGTQTNMNVNEVIAHVANARAHRSLLHPNDDVNLSQSSNDTFPSAMHIAIVLEVERSLLPAMDEVIRVLKEKEAENAGIMKSGRTHLMDAVPVAFSQEISGWRAALEEDRAMLVETLDHVRQLAVGGTAVGTGLNAPEGFDKAVCRYISTFTGTRFIPAENKFRALTMLDDVVAVHGVIKASAMDMMKMANDVRWMASGPRNGLGEIRIPANEPGSSIMPGKVNPTQCEQVTMVAVQILGNDAAVSFASSQGNFELNTYLPVSAYNVLQSIRLLADSMRTFAARCLAGMEARKETMENNLRRSLMLSTLLSPVIGYARAAEAAQKADRENCTLKEACLSLGYLDGETFDALFAPFLKPENESPEGEK